MKRSEALVERSNKFANRQRQLDAYPDSLMKRSCGCIFDEVCRIRRFVLVSCSVVNILCTWTMSSMVRIRSSKHNEHYESHELVPRCTSPVAVSETLLTPTGVCRRQCSARLACGADRRPARARRRAIFRLSLDTLGYQKTSQRIIICCTAQGATGKSRRMPETLTG